MAPLGAARQRDPDACEAVRTLGYGTPNNSMQRTALRAAADAGRWATKPHLMERSGQLHNGIALDL